MIHYGLYSLLGGEWHGQTVPWYAEWIRHTAKIPREAYRAHAMPLSLYYSQARDWDEVSGK